MNKTKCTREKVNTWKEPVGMTFPEGLVEIARHQGLNISKVTENALLSILDYLKAQNDKQPSFLNECSFIKENSVDRAGFEPATSALRMRRSYQTELPAPFRFLSEKNHR